MNYNTLPKDTMLTISKLSFYLLVHIHEVVSKYRDYFAGEDNIYFDCSEVCVPESPHFGNSRYAMKVDYSSADQNCYEFVLYRNGNRIASVSMNRYTFFSTDGMTLNFCDSSIDCGPVLRSASTFRYEYLESDDVDSPDEMFRLPNKELTEEAYFQHSLVHNILLEREDINTALSICHSLPENYMRDVYYGYTEGIFQYLDQYAIHKGLVRGLENIVQERLCG